MRKISQIAIKHKLGSFLLPAPDIQKKNLNFCALALLDCTKIEIFFLDVWVGNIWSWEGKKL